MEIQKTEAVLIHAGVVIARTKTSARSGAIVSYGWDRVGKAIHEIGKARVSRAKGYLENQELMLSLEDRVALVNLGGGEPI